MSELPPRDRRDDTAQIPLSDDADVRQYMNRRADRAEAPRGFISTVMERVAATPIAVPWWQRPTTLLAGVGTAAVVAAILAILVLTRGDAPDGLGATASPGSAAGTTGTPLPTFPPAGTPAPTPSTTPTETPSATPAPAASPTPTATSAPTATPIPQAFTRVAAFPGASSSAITSWSGGWIAAGQADEGPSVWLSADGSTWESHEPAGLDGAVDHLVAIPDGRLLAFGFVDDGSLGGQAATWVSSDGLEWQRLDIGLPDLLIAADVAAGPLGLVMIGRAEPNASGSNEYAWYSADGLSWERVWETAEDDLPAAIGAGPEGFVFVGQQGYEQGTEPIGLAFASADGREWIEAPTEGDLGMAGPVWSVVPIGGDWMASSQRVGDVHGLRSPNGLDWTLDPAFPAEDARQSGVAELVGDDRFALLGWVPAESTTLPVLLFSESGGWQQTQASTWGSIAAASRDGVTVLMVNAGRREAPELEFWVAATPA